jgi:sterol desaturase/sphingolipid hydroxylase (fatty acid hydroxylase superfamily)
MFDSPFLDRLSRVHPAVVPLIFVPAIAVLAVAAWPILEPRWTIFAWAAGGWFFWTLTEYWMHRVVFHFKPEKGFGARLHWIIHGVHHDHPNDPMRLVMPPSVSIPLATGFCLLFVFSLGVGRGLAFGSGFLLGYLVYDMTHYHVHHHTPTTALGKKMRELHMRHHFQDETRGYGVSAPFWDVVFGTAPRRRSGTTQ